MQSPDKTQSPLFDVLSGDFAHFIRTCYTDAFYTDEELNRFYTKEELNGFKKNPNALRKTIQQIVKIHKDDPQCRSVTSIEDAENRLFNMAHSATESWDQLPFALRRQAALVANRGRRGYANQFLMHPSMAHRIHLENWLDGERFMFRPVGRWFEMGVMPKRDRWGSTVYVSEHLPENEAYVFYKNSSADAPAMVLCNDDALVLAIPSGVDILHNVSHYITKVTFE